MSLLLVLEHDLVADATLDLVILKSHHFLSIFVLRNSVALICGGSFFFKVSENCRLEPRLLFCGLLSIRADVRLGLDILLVKLMVRVRHAAFF